MSATIPTPTLIPANEPQALGYTWKAEGYGIEAFGSSQADARQRFIALALEKGIFYRTYGRLFLVTQVFTDDAAANLYMSEHPEAALIGVNDDHIFLADVTDKGIPLAS